MDIRLRVIGFGRPGQYHFICLDTNIVIRAENYAHARLKMGDALVSYFRSFTDEEIEQGLYIRRAPAYYEVVWKIGKVVAMLQSVRKFFTREKANYDPTSEQLRFA